MGSVSIAHEAELIRPLYWQQTTSSILLSQLSPDESQNAIVPKNCFIYNASKLVNEKLQLIIIVAQ